MSGPAIVVVASFFTLYLAVTNADPVVVDNYYKEGLAINRVLARDHVALQRGYRASVMLNGDRSRLRIHMAGEGLPAELRVRFVHPTRGGLDRDVTARQIQPGFYEAAIELAPAARWDVELGDPAQQWRVTGDWYTSDDSFVLEPRRG
jgi:hypothetical protein